MTLVTVLGGSGFIGSHLTSRLREVGIRYQSPARDADLHGMDLGCVVYCVGLTADFRERLLDTVEAHVCHLLRLLQRGRMDVLVYLSSTRVYRRSTSPATEDTVLGVSPLDREDVYDVSKVMGEALALTHPGRVHVLRLSNVYGPGMAPENFLSSLIRDAVQTGAIMLRSAPTSAKDYVSISDVLDAIMAVAEKGISPVYNVASGANVTHQALVEHIARLTGCRVSSAPDVPEIVQPVISTRRLEEEFGYRPARVLDDLPSLVASFSGKD